MAITVQGSVPYPSPDGQQQTTSRPLGYVHMSIPRTTISTVSISRRPTANHVPTTLFRTTVNTVQRSVPYQSPDVKQQTTSRSPGFVQRRLPYEDPYPTYLPTLNNKPRTDHPFSSEVHYRTRSSTVPISRRQTANYLPTTRFRTMVITEQGSVPYVSLDDKQQTTPPPPSWVQ